jgi:uncharacterized protein (DUF488 family)
MPVASQTAAMPSLPFHTVGHSNRSTEQLIDLLQQAAIEEVIDVRAFPRSRSQPRFNLEVLPEDLHRASIGYRHLPALGGRRPERLAEASPNGYWRHPSFRRYADYAMTPPFRDALAELRAIGRQRRCALMCAEAVWWRCHRRLIADYLLAAGDQVLHILALGRIDPATLTPAARPGPEDGTLIYPP